MCGFVKKSNIFISFISLSICFSSGAVSSEPINYTSLFQIPQIRIYCTDKKISSKYRCITNGRIIGGTCCGVVKIKLK